MKYKFEFTPYELTMIKSFAVNSIIAGRYLDRHLAIVNATFSMIHAKGYDLKSEKVDFSKFDLNVKLSKEVSLFNVFNLNGEPSEHVISRILEYLDSNEIYIVKSEGRMASFKEPIRVLYQDPPKKEWVF